MPLPTNPGRLLAALVFLTAIAPAAMSAPSRQIRVEGAWARPAPASANGAGYMTIVNRGPLSDRLIGASSQAAASVSLHVTRQVGAVMTMRTVPYLAVSPGAHITLAPEGYHLMLQGLRRPLIAGRSVALSLTFARAGVVPVTLAVRAFGPDMPAPTPAARR